MKSIFFVFVVVTMLTSCGDGSKQKDTVIKNYRIEIIDNQQIQMVVDVDTNDDGIVDVKNVPVTRPLDKLRIMAGKEENSVTTATLHKSNDDKYSIGTVHFKCARIKTPD